MDEKHFGGLWCHQVLQHLDAYVEGSLSSEELAAVRTHVRSCDACARFGTAYSQLVDILRREAPVEGPGEEVLERLKLRLQEGRG